LVCLLVETNREFVEVVPASDGLDEVVKDARVDTLGKFEPLALDLVRKVLSDSIVEVPEVAGAVLVIARRLPHALDTLTHTLAHHLALFEAEQDGVPLGLSDSRMLETLERRSRFLEGVDRATEGITHEVRVEGLGMLAGHTNSRNGDGKTVRADEADHPHLEGGTERAVKGVLDLEAEHKVLTADLDAVVLEVIDSTDTSPAVSADGLTGVVAKALGLKEVLDRVEEVLVLEDLVAFADHAKDLVVVRADISEEAGSRAVGQVERDLLDFVIKAGGLAFGFVFVFDDVVIHTRVSISVFYVLSNFIFSLGSPRCSNLRPEGFPR
jgi:hypothetical protein